MGRKRIKRIRNKDGSKVSVTKGPTNVGDPSRGSSSPKEKR